MENIREKAGKKGLLKDRTAANPFLFLADIDAVSEKNIDTVMEYLPGVTGDYLVDKMAFDKWNKPSAESIQKHMSSGHWITRELLSDGAVTEMLLKKTGSVPLKITRSAGIAPAGVVAYASSEIPAANVL